MEHRIETELGRLAVFEQGRGPAVLLWPSLYLDHHSLDALVAELAGEWRCVTLDGPGHGQSPGPTQLYDLAACARTAARVLDALGIEAVHWVGNAWGGHVGVRAAVDFPERIRSLAALGAPLHPLDARMRLKTRLLLGLLQGGLGSLAASALAGAMLSPRSPSHLRDAIRRSVLEAPRRGLVRAIRSVSLDRGDLVRELPNVHCPVLFLVGADDSMYPPARAAQECASMAGARFVVVEAAAHLVPMERPRETAALLRSHLSSAGVRPDTAHATSFDAGSRSASGLTCASAPPPRTRSTPSPR